MKFSCTTVALLSAALVSGERLEERGERMALRADEPTDPDRPNGFPGEADEWVEQCASASTLGTEEYADYCYKKTLFTGYSTEDHEQMTNFVTAVCGANNLAVTDSIALRAFVKYFDEECDSSTYKNMVDQLVLAKGGSPECGGGWVKDLSGSSASASLLDAGTNKSTTAAGSGTSLALRRVHQSTMEVDERSNKKALIRIIKLYLQEVNYDAETLAAKADDIATAYLAATDLDIAADNTYANFRTTIINNIDSDTFAGTFPAQADGEFTESDYTNAAQSKAKMADFIYKKIDKMDLKIKNFSGLLGMVPWYTSADEGGCGEQTYEKLTSELTLCTAGAHPVGASPGQDFQCGGWIWSDGDNAETTE